MNKCFLHLVSLTGFCSEAHNLEGFPCDSAGKESTCSAGDLGLVPGLGRSPGEGKGYPIQYAVLENSMDCIVHEVAKNRTQLSCFHFTSHSLDVILSFKKNFFLIEIIADDCRLTCGYKTCITEENTLSSFPQWSHFVKLQYSICVSLPVLP